MIDRFNKYSDLIGITGSTICLIHCIATSGITLISALLTQSHGHHHHSHSLDMWGWVDLSMVVVSIIAVYFAAKTAHYYYIKAVLWTFLTLFISATLGKFVFHDVHWIEILSWVGSIGLISSHFYNLYICRTEDVDSCPVKAV